MPRTCTALLIIAVAIGSSGDVSGQAYLSAVGYTELQARLGAATPNGAGVRVAQVEAGESNIYAPDPVVALGRPGFSITHMSGASGYFSHATGVADNFFGNTSMANGITRVDSWNTNDWLMSGFLSSAGGLPPTSNIPKVSNHSYAGSAGASSDTYLRRVDYLVDRGGQIVVAAAGASADPLIGAAPNAISVGSFWGGYRPHIVAPTGTLSDATPVISSAAALLVQAAGSTQFASNPQTIKAVLLAGASKTGFNGNWAHTQTQPLDQTFGAGQLNVNNSHLILTAGRKAASNSATVAGTGWDFNSVSNGTSARNYFFDVPAGTSNTLSAALTWHRVVDASLNASMADLNLKLYQADTNFNLVGSPLDQSISATDNVEHVWLPNGLPAGRYAWRVEMSGSGTADYALAWQTVQLVPVPEPASVLAVASALLALGARLRRRARRSSIVSS